MRSVQRLAVGSQFRSAAALTLIFFASLQQLSAEQTLSDLTANLQSFNGTAAQTAVENLAVMSGDALPAFEPLTTVVSSRRKFRVDVREAAVWAYC